MINLNRLAFCTITGLIAGALVGGAGARIAMRGVALIGEMQPSFTIGGTFAIFIMGGILGAIAGLLLGLVWKWLPGQPAVKGGVFGGVSALLVGVLLFRSGGGELDLATPPVRAALFAWIPLVWGLAAGWLAGRLAIRFSAAPSRQTGLAGLIFFGFCLLLALMSMFSLASESLSLPGWIARAARDWGWAGLRITHTLAMALFALAYCGLCSLIFWQAAGRRLAVGAACALLLFAAAFIQNGRTLTSALDFLNLGQALAGLLRAVGLVGLLAILLLWPDGGFRPAWGRWVLALWGAIWLLLWFLAPLSGLAAPTDLPEPVLVLAVMGGLFTGLAGQWLRYRQADAAGRHIQRPVIAAFSLVLLVYLLVWVVQIVYPDLRARGLPPLATPLAFFPFLLPWLFLPLSLWVSLRRQAQSAIPGRPALVGATPYA